MKNKKLNFAGIFIIGLFLYLVTWDIPIDELKSKYTNEQSQFVEIDGMQVHYRDEGKGMPIVLIHGTGASLHTWDDWANELKKSYRVIRFDLPAFGLTGPHPNKDYNIKTYSGFVDSFLTKLKIDSLHLAGNSLGGNIAWIYAAEHPGKVQKLVLIDPTGFMKDKEQPWIFTLAQTPILNWVIEYITPKSLIEDNIKQVYFDDSKITPELIDRYYDMTLRTGNRTAFIDRAKTKLVDNTDMLKGINNPTLLMWGKEDIWIPVTDGDKFLGKLPNAKLVVLENVGHVPMEESPSESLQPFLEFLKQE